MGDTQLHLRWHSHTFTFTGMLHELHAGKSFTDVSLICDGGVVRAHRAVLSLCSPYLATVLAACSENDEAPLLLPEIPVQDVRYLISFIYRGQVDVPQQHIASFLNTGKHLHVLGLEQGDQLVDSPCKSEGSSTHSDPEDEAVASRDAAGGGANNNNGEKKVEETVQSKAPSDPGPVRNSSIIKVEDMKVEQEPLEEGKIDLNFYLQQAIQSASMPCPLCKKEFKSQSGLRDHIRLHTGERPFICDFCHMNFARASHLKRHRRMHTGEKPFECAICGKDFSRGDKLKDHLRRHEAEDKLHQIRKQILNLEDNVESLTTTSGPSHSAVTLPNINTFAAVSQNTSLTSTSTPQLILSKVTATKDPSLPPAKRQCINPKVPLFTMAQMSQGMGTIPSLIGSQSENVGPPMMGVTSIGECILRPIN